MSNAWGWLSGALVTLAALVGGLVTYLFTKKSPAPSPEPARAKAAADFEKQVERLDHDYREAAAAVEAKREGSKALVVRRLEVTTGPLVADDQGLTEHLKGLAEDVRKGP